MARHIQVTCPNCRRDDLQIRPENLGRKLRCNHCDHVFRTGDAADRADQGRPPTPPEAPPSTRVLCPNCQHLLTFRDDLIGRKIRCKYCDQKYRIQSKGHLIPIYPADQVAPGGASATDVGSTSDAEGRTLRAELQARDAAHAETLARLTAVEDELRRSRAEADNLREEAEHLRIQDIEVVSARRERDQAVAERDRLGDLANALRVKDDEVASLRDELAASRRELDQIRGELREARDAENASTWHDPPSVLGSTEVVELRREPVHDSLGSTEIDVERAEIRKELRRIQDELRARTEEGEAVGHDQEERAALAADRQRLETELAARGAEADRLAAELAARGAEADRLAAELAARGAEADRLAAELAALEAQRRASEARVAALADEVRGLRDERKAEGEQHGRIAREHEDVRQERGRLQEEVRGLKARVERYQAEADRQARLAAELESLRAERDQTLVGRLSEARQVEQLRGKVAEMERTHAEALARLEDAARDSTLALEEARSRWEHDRRGVLEAAERARREAIDATEAERDEERRRAAAEARARADEHATTLARLETELADRRAAAEADRRDREAIAAARDEAIRRLADLEEERSRLAARRDEAEAARLESDREHRAEVDRLNEALDQVRKLQEATTRRNDDLAAHVSKLLARIEDERSGRLDDRKEFQRTVASLEGSMIVVRNEDSAEWIQAPREEDDEPAEADADAERESTPDFEVVVDEARERQAPEVVVSCRGVLKYFGTGNARTQALRGVSLDLYSGQMTLLVGPSGCGKTTLISIMAGTLDADDGDLKVLGDDMIAMSSAAKVRFRRRNIGFVFQQFNLLPALTAAQNAALPLLIAGWPRRRAFQRASEILTTLGLGNRLDHLPSKLSGGQQQRVAIARSLTHEPRLLICDEPTSALDAESGHTTMQLLREVALQPGRAVVIVTHDSRIFDFSDRTVYMEDGHVVSVRRGPMALGRPVPARPSGGH